MKRKIIFRGSTDELYLVRYRPPAQTWAAMVLQVKKKKGGKNLFSFPLGPEIREFRLLKIFQQKFGMKFRES